MRSLCDDCRISCFDVQHIRTTGFCFVCVIVSLLSADDKQGR